MFIPLFLVILLPCSSMFVIQRNKPTNREHLVIAESLCERKFFPCACRKVLTTVSIKQDNGEIKTHTYPQYTCDDEENDRRKQEGRIAAQYHCVNVTTPQRLYPEAKGPSGRLTIQRTVGCDVRCISPHCNKSLEVGKSSEAERNSRPGIHSRVNDANKILGVEDWIVKTPQNPAPIKTTKAGQVRLMLRICRHAHDFGISDNAICKAVVGFA